jgi:hypothetical protein
MGDTSPQHPTGYTCTVCGRIAVADTDGTYLCAVDAIAAMIGDADTECDTPFDAGPERAVLVDLTDVGEVRPTRTRRHRVVPSRLNH